MQKFELEGLFDFLNKGVSAFHSAAAAAAILEANGYEERPESAAWELVPGGKYYTTRNGSAVLAWRMPKGELTGWHVTASHSDSPTWKIKELDGEQDAIEKAYEERLKAASLQAEAEKLLRDAHLLSEAGCFGIVLEKIPAALAARVTAEIPTPTIGIGAGAGCDGQVLVIHDMLGINKGFSPRFLRRYADLHTVMTGAVEQYVRDVKECDFPNEKEQY